MALKIKHCFCLFQFRYATALDIFLMLFGTIMAVIHGAGFPFLAIIFGDMSNVLLGTDIQRLIASETTVTTAYNGNPIEANMQHMGRRLMQAPVVAFDPSVKPDVVGQANPPDQPDTVGQANLSAQPMTTTTSRSSTSPTTSTSTTTTSKTLNDDPAKIISSVEQGDGSRTPVSQSSDTSGQSSGDGKTKIGINNNTARILSSLDSTTASTRTMSTPSSTSTQEELQTKPDAIALTLSEAVGTTVSNLITSVKPPNIDMTLESFNSLMTTFSLYYVGIGAIVFVATLLQVSFFSFLVI